MSTKRMKAISPLFSFANNVIGQGHSIHNNVRDALFLQLPRLSEE
ncbi:hypothetical protein [Colwellia sp. 75C3]|nr:hypothetical protein [Colwellia sp. 75C3]